MTFPRLTLAWAGWFAALTRSISPFILPISTLLPISSSPPLTACSNCEPQASPEHPQARPRPPRLSPTLHPRPLPLLSSAQRSRRTVPPLALPPPHPTRLHRHSRRHPRRRLRRARRLARRRRPRHHPRRRPSPRPRQARPRPPRARARAPNGRAGGARAGRGARLLGSGLCG